MTPTTAGVTATMTRRWKTQTARESHMTTNKEVAAVLARMPLAEISGKRARNPEKEEQMVLERRFDTYFFCSSFYLSSFTELAVWNILSMVRKDHLHKTNSGAGNK